MEEGEKEGWRKERGKDGGEEHAREGKWGIKKEERGGE